LDEIEKAAFRASSLANQLLAFNKPQAVRKSSLQMSELLVEVTKMLKRLLGEAIQLSITSEENLCSVLADRSQIEQVLINLVVGVREVLGNGGKLQISATNIYYNAVRKTLVGNVPPGNYVRVSLELLPDPGKKKIKSIEKNRSVSAALKVVEQNGGYLIAGKSITARMELEILLPVAVDLGKGIRKRTPERVTKEAKILLVEDDSAMRQFAKIVLKRLGHHVVDAADGVQALELLETEARFEPDLLITDLVMPRMGGADLAKQLQISYPGIGVLFISGYSDQLSTVDLFEGERVFLKKPFEIGELISAVGNLLLD
jgi:two-component system, cell cycle sensor histidine kinase and response regulator CckA